VSNNPKYSNAAVNAEADALATLLNNGYLRIYDGAQPANADAALSGNTLLAELRFGNPAFASAVAGLLTANAMTADSAADATGNATFFRAYKSDGTSVVFDGTVGTAAADLILDSVAIQLNADVAITAFTHQVSKG
jgi:hypothetical protein